jgi:hypothetical protein
MERSASWEVASRSDSSISQHFIEPKVSLPCLQEPTTGFYSEPVHITPSKIHFNIIFHPSLGHPSGLWPSGFPIKNLYAFLFFALSPSIGLRGLLLSVRIKFIDLLLF